MTFRVCTSVAPSGREPRVLGDRHVLRLEGDRAADQSRQLPAQVAVEIALRANDLDPLHAAGGLDVAPVGQEPDAIRCGESGGVRARESGQVADIRSVRDEQRLGLELGTSSWSRASRPLIPCASRETRAPSGSRPVPRR